MMSQSRDYYGNFEFLTTHWVKAKSGNFFSVIFASVVKKDIQKPFRFLRATISKKCQKIQFKYNDYRSVINIAENIKQHIISLDIYNLHTRTASFSYQEKLLKKVDSG